MDGKKQDVVVTSPAPAAIDQTVTVEANERLGVAANVQPASTPQRAHKHTNEVCLMCQLPAVFLRN